MRNTWIVGSRRAVARSVRRILTTAPSAFVPIVAIAVISTLALAGFAPQAAAATQIHLDHWANGGSPLTATHWVDGNLHWTNSTYHEGDADPTRFVMDSLPAGTHTLTFSWVVSKKQGKVVKHAHDFLTTYNFSGAVVAGVDPCLPRVQGGGNGPNVCTLGSAPDGTFAIPSDGQLKQSNGFKVSQAPGVFSIWGGQITGVSAYSYSLSSAFSGTQANQMTVTFTTLGGDVVLALGGHLARDDNWNKASDGDGAQDINGAPYHWNYDLVQLVDGSAVKEATGNRDRSIMIMQKGGVVHHKHCIDHPKNPHSHDQFPFTASQPAGLVDGLPSAFNLACDEDQGAAVGELVSGAFSVAEASSPDSDFDLDVDSVDCRLILSGKDVGHASGFAKDASGAAAFNFIAGDNVHCHFTNRKKGSITLTKALLPNDDPGRFNLLVDGKTCATSVGDGGACSPVKVKGGTTHALSETAAAGGNLADYAQTTKCVDQFGDSVAVSTGSVTVPPGANLVCTITNQFTNPPNGHLIVIKHVINHYIGTGTAGDFLITVQGKTAQPGVDCAGRDVQVNEGTFTVGEGAYRGYTASYPGRLDRSAYCSSPNNTLVDSDCTSGSVFVPRGATKYCVVVNEDNAVSAQGRMTGGSAGIAVDGGRIKVTQGFELHCGTPPSEPNNLEINWPGHRFHLDTLSSAFCYDAPGIGPAPPVAAFDTMIGQGTGSLDGVPGAKISFTFADAGEPGTSDTIVIKINGGAALNVSGPLWNGNLQAH